MDSLPDKELIRLFNEGRTEAYDHLYSRYENRVFRMAMLRLQDVQLAEDVMQETFLCIYRGLPKFRGDAKFSSWIFRITANECYSMLRRRDFSNRVSCHPDPIKLVPEEGFDPFSEDPDSGKEALARQFDQALIELPERFRRVLVMRVVGGMSYAEMAHTLGVAKGTVQSQLFRARLALREKMAPQPEVI